MNLTNLTSRSARPRRAGALLPALVIVLSTGLLLPLGAAQAATAVPLGTAESFAVLAGSTITNTGPSTVTGDVGLHPGTDVTGFADVTHDGALHVTDAVALQAKTDLDTAYTNAAGQTPVTEIPTELGGTKLMAGVYNSAAGTFGITGTLTLDGADNPDAVFIFQMGSTLTTASGSSIELVNGADLCNVYWQVGSSATLGGDSDFVGTVMADQSITLITGATVQGRVLARSAGVTMDTNTITNAACTTGSGTDDEGTAEDGDTTSQVEDVPTGPVATGDGSTEAATTGSSWQLTLAFTLLLVGATVGILARRRVKA